MLPGLPQGRPGADTPCGRKWPERFSAELAALNRHGRVLEHGRLGAPPGFFAVHHLWNHGGRALDMVTVFPPGFPVARPEIRLNNPADRPRGHCDPTNGNLCYLAHHRHAWQPRRLVADYIAERLPMILDGAGDEGEPVAEPAEHWWTTLVIQGSILVVESDWTLASATIGNILLRTVVERGRPPVIRCLADAVMDGTGGALARRQSALPLEFAEAATLSVPWRLFDRELKPDEHARVLEEVLAGAPRRGVVKLPGGRHARMAVAVCPTEIAHGRAGLSWIMLAQTGDGRSLEQGRGVSVVTNSARTLRAGPGERRSRSPSAATLEGRKIAVVGLGAIGAPVALDLVQNGAAQVAMGDHDIVTPGNAVRWPLGESAWGRFKVDALALHIAANHAGLATPVSRRMIGDIDLDAPLPDDAAFAEAVTAADLIVDCTASAEAERLLADRARSMGVPLVSTYGTATLGGGIVACFVPGGACPMCLLHHRSDGSLTPPPGEEGDGHAVQLPGCAEATFAGASHDLAELSMQAVRVIVRAFAQKPASSFVETLSFDADRRPHWRIDSIARHPACDCV